MTPPPATPTPPQPSDQTADTDTDADVVLTTDEGAQESDSPVEPGNS